MPVVGVSRALSNSPQGLIAPLLCRVVLFDPLTRRR